MELQKGQKLKLSDFTSSTQIEIVVSAQTGAGEADFTCFGVNAAGKISDDRYFIFYNQNCSPDNAIVMTSGAQTAFTVQTDRLPEQIQKLVIAVSTDGGLIRDVSEGLISLRSGGSSADYRFSGQNFSQERALILCELYRKDGIWRYTVVSSGFNGGLDALLTHFGGQVANPQQQAAPSPAPAPAPSPAPAPAPKVNLSKISLKKSGDSHRINLSKNSGELHVNLNWNTGRKKLFGGGGAVDLDLACMFRLKSGEQGVIQALGNSFGSAAQLHYILLDQDDRSGTSANGENMYFKRPELIDFAVVFAFIYEGTPNWRGTNASVTIKQSGAPDIEIQIDSPDSRNRFCVFASLSGKSGELEVKREERFFQGHKEVDDFYRFGFRWVAGRK